MLEFSSIRRLGVHLTYGNEVFMLNTTVLNENRDFKRLYYKGKSLPHPLLIVYAQKNRLGANRIGITASKKVGNAVHRNRAKRIVREAYRLLEPQLPCGWDFVFVARQKTTQAAMNDIYVVMAKNVAKLTGPAVKKGL